MCSREVAYHRENTLRLSRFNLIVSSHFSISFDDDAGSEDVRCRDKVNPERLAKAIKTVVMEQM